jgi:hypothetical protein
MAAAVTGRRAWAWTVYWLGRLLQVTGLLVTMLRMMLVGVVLFIPGWLLARRPPGSIP